MITPCYTNVQPGLPIYEAEAEAAAAILSSSSPPPTHEVNSHFLYNLLLLKDKLHQVESLASITVMPSSPPFNRHHHRMDQPPESTSAVTLPSMATLIQDIIVTASSMMFSCQQMSLGSSTPNNDNNDINPPASVLGPPAAFFSNHQETVNCDHDHWYDHNNYNSMDHAYNNNNTNRSIILDVGNTIATTNDNYTKKMNLNPERELIPPQNYDIIELNAADLLAKYTHHCQVCGKGFKRDANLRMHMRAHGEQYKSIAALISPSKSNTSGGGDQRSKYSCPQEGCRWNKGHVKFQPLKSMICAKNHYRRSHCPKMYVCKRCGGKHFSVLSDLRTHEKHCGDLKWQCSCGTTFSRKDKLMGHLAVFVGHTSAVRKGEDDLTRH